MILPTPDHHTAIVYPPPPHCQSLIYPPPSPDLVHVCSDLTFTVFVSYFQLDVWTCSLSASLIARRCTQVPELFEYPGNGIAGYVGSVI